LTVRRHHFRAQSRGVQFLDSPAAEGEIGVALVSPQSDIPQRDLIFDLGLHRGYDAEFYLCKGFRVVGLEAVPALCAIAASRLAAHGDRITIVNKALASQAGREAVFYSVPGKDDWGSLDKNAAEKGTQASVEISVTTTDLAELFNAFGVPYYIKCDLEGADVVFRDQLLGDSRRPAFVSLEVNSEKDIDVLADCAYDRAQLVNQWMHPFTRPPNPSREGNFHDARFTGETSGLFGLELPPEKWRPLGEIRQMYLDWRALKARDNGLAPGWLDCHVCRQETLVAGSTQAAPQAPAVLADPPAA
jgi:FkbM family methyltransferase